MGSVWNGRLDIHISPYPSLYLDCWVINRMNAAIGVVYEESSKTHTTGRSDSRLLLLPAFKRRFLSRNRPPRVDFAFVREARWPSGGSYFSFMTKYAKWNMSYVGFPNFTTTVQFSSDIYTDDGIRYEVLQMEWNGVLVNVCFKRTEVLYLWCHEGGHPKHLRNLAPIPLLTTEDKNCNHRCFTIKSIQDGENIKSFIHNNCCLKICQDFITILFL
ncbi:hypothetical protein AVEN_91630-1 [Araneus ventricosus]|uniref:Uncharacterized protein n=1 Tax=Araneus ventricosus TaxID=182803 RepID=A0A4Y2EVH3_ARAVE|nr:hypothetical protein AVEN_91630-1 [Araneus ventricosus]